MEEVEFHPRFVDAIRNGEKTSTIRYWDEYRLLPGEPFATVQADTGDIISNERCEDVEDLTAKQIVERGVDGHEEYDSVEELTEAMEEFYPDEVIVPSTIFKVVHW